MKRKQYCCDASRSIYEDYYVNQSGSGVGVFQGSRMQRGHGFGSFLSGLFRNAWPVIKSGAKAIGKQALKTGVQIATDLVDGEKFVDSSKRRISEGIKEFTSTRNDTQQTGSGRKRRKQTGKGRISKKPRVDIFGAY